jgi:hypothetical protein
MTLHILWIGGTDETDFERGYDAARTDAAKLADTQRNVRVYCDYLPRMIKELRPLKPFGPFA